MRVPGHKLTVEWSGERGAESSSTGTCLCGGWTESASNQREVRAEYRYHLQRVAPSPTVTLPVDFLSMYHYEDCRMGPRGVTNRDLWWFDQDYDGDYTYPVRPATPDEIAAQATLDAAIEALVREAGG